MFTFKSVSYISFIKIRKDFTAKRHMYHNFRMILKAFYLLKKPLNYQTENRRHAVCVQTQRFDHVDDLETLELICILNRLYRNKYIFS